ncbi:TIM barrel protein [Enterococcus hulanensis]|uniref:TIM barrel protein n=1 Tax=Enterococcus hulanensis TaxID=2559929 RepID=UPI00288CDCB7|nr:TIM barrel protein [Enterococcus hulanensis]MDT2660745.1 TIM barrel protein [Enterococcus hulanensis]
MCTKYPKIFLVLDNCFALKRWVDPEEWIKVTKEIGFDYVEASFDNEIDFLYSPDSYIDKWFRELEKYEQKYDVKVVNFHTGYQTYRTVGLAHNDEDYVSNLVDVWFKKAIDQLSKRENGLGFAFHAIPLNSLKNKEKYNQLELQVKNELDKICSYASSRGNSKISIEAMYAPHQPPWTIEMAKNYLNYNKDLYITIDVGHMIGQKKFKFPSMDIVKASIKNRNQLKYPDFVLFSDKAQKMWKAFRKQDFVNKSEIEKFYDEISAYDYLYSKSDKDADPYAWLEELGCYSPIIHLQQTDGITAHHAPFTEKTNKNGIVEPKELLKAIKKSYEKKQENLTFGEEKKVENIYLSFEIFSSNTDTEEEIIDRLKETCEYWRQIIPEDGIDLDKLV